VVAFFAGLSPESLALRFHGARRVDARMVEPFLDPDWSRRGALLGSLEGEVVALASYERLAGRDTAEVAFVVADGQQRRGIGTRLLEQLAARAREEGITEFVAEVMAGNAHAVRVFADTGFELVRELEGGEIELRFPIVATGELALRVEYRDHVGVVASLRPFFEPRSVAVIGASRRRGSIGGELFRNILTADFTGAAYPVNRGGEAVAGVRAYRAVDELPELVDLAVICLPGGQVLEAADAALRRGVRALCVISAGFAEMGTEGRARQDRLLALVRAYGARLVGPNCLGIAVPPIGLNATFAPRPLPAGRIGFSSQSGALGLALLDYAAGLNLGISSFVSVGNKADVSGNDLIQYWVEDPRTDVILLYLESFGNPVHFSRIARRVARRKPIVAVKAGRSSAGARAASSHTGALAETDEVVDALFRQAGVIRAQTLEELFDVAMLLAHQPLPGGRRVGILTNAGGPGILAADACAAQGLELPSLSAATQRALRAFLPPAASVGNPVDLLAAATPEHYREAERVLLADASLDSLLVIFIPPIAENTEAVAAAIVEGATGASKTVLATFLSAKGAPPILAPIPCYPFPEAAAVALARTAAYAEWRRRPAGSVPDFADVSVERARTIVDRSLARGGGWIGPAEAAELLDAFGIQTAPLALVRDAAGAAAAAARLGFPVAVKAVGPAILHKTEVGGVRLGLASAAAVEAACRELKERLGDGLTEYLVQAMVPGGAEVIVGATWDPTFGPLVLYGSGGTLVELLGDVAFRLHPLTDADAASMLDEVRGTALLRGYRGAPRRDEEALRALLLRVSALVDRCPEVREMDLNPVMVLEHGVRVVDARIRIERRPLPPPSRRIAY
ncbi:MAG TPA: GNAT family N-acetyltransferase, partial [Thermoanaerobaculia bacterium]